MPRLNQLARSLQHSTDTSADSIANDGVTNPFGGDEAQANGAPPMPGPANIPGP